MRLIGGVEVEPSARDPLHGSQPQQSAWIDTQYGRAVVSQSRTDRPGATTQNRSERASDEERRAVHVLADGEDETTEHGEHGGQSCS
jgi:hypothetical protein